MLFIWGGLLIWAADFLFIYAFAALACARRFADERIAGFGVVQVATLASSVAALTATAWLMRNARRELRERPAARFHAFLAAALSGLAVLAIVWTALPPLMSGTCD
jgi:hypothetical protein